MTAVSGPYDGHGRQSPRWWPSRYGPNDVVGAGNELTPQRTLAALKLPSEGRLIELAQILEHGVPAVYPGRLSSGSSLTGRWRGSRRYRAPMT